MSHSVENRGGVSRRQFLEDIGCAVLVISPFLAISAGTGICIYDEVSKQNARIDALRKLRLDQPHDLLDLASIPGFELEGKFRGFLGISGDINGGSETFVTFAWKPDPNKDTFYITQLPTSKTRFDVVEEDINPRVLFQFDENIIKHDGEINFDNPNDIIKNAKMAILTLDKKDFNQITPK